MSAMATWAISKREIRSYFNSPVAYIVATVYMLIVGWFFFSQIFVEKQATMRGYFGLTPLVFSFIIPAITMRLIAEEKNTGTIETLITLPVRDWQVVFGKFLGAMMVVATMIGLTVFYAITVNSLGPLDSGPAIAGYIGLLLMGGAYVAIGVMASSFTKNQIVAFILAFGICFALFLASMMVPYAPKFLQPFLAFMSISEHFNAIARGVLDSRDVIYYLSLMAVCLVVATVSLDARRWR